MSSFTNLVKSLSDFATLGKSGFIGYILAELEGEPAFTMVGEEEDFILTFDDGSTWYNITKSD